MTIRSLPSLLLLLCGLLLVPFGAAAQTDRATAQALMHKSGLWQQLAAVGPQFRAGLLEGLAQRSANLSAPELERLSRIVDESYSAARLRATALATITRSINAKHVASLRKWYDSAPGVAITKLEEAASDDRRDPSVIVQEGSEFLATVSAPRRALLEQVVSVTRSADAMAAITINTAVSIQRGILSAAPGGPVIPPSDLIKELEAQRSQMLQGFTALALATYSKMYAAISDADLESYVAFLKTPAGQHFTSVGLAALDAALGDAARALGRSLPGAKDGTRT